MSEWEYMPWRMQPIIEVPWRSPSNELINLKYRYMMAMELPDIRAVLSGIVDDGWRYTFDDYAKALVWLASEDAKRGIRLINRKQQRKHHKGRHQRSIRRWMTRNDLIIAKAVEWLRRTEAAR